MDGSGLGTEVMMAIREHPHHIYTMMAPLKYASPISQCIDNAKWCLLLLLCVRTKQFFILSHKPRIGKQQLFLYQRRSCCAALHTQLCTPNYTQHAILFTNPPPLKPLCAPIPSRRHFFWKN